MSDHSAFVETQPELVFENLAAIAERNGFKVLRANDAMKIDAPLGIVDLQVKNGGTKISFSAATAPELQLLKDLYAQRFASLGIAENVTWDAPTSRYPLNQMTCTVTNSEQISPNFHRIRSAGDFTAFAKPGVGLHFRFLFGPDKADWPSLDGNGLTYWPGGVNAWHRPPYTVRRLSAKADWIDVDIVLHEGGRVTEWCHSVRRGDQMALHGPGGSKQPNAKHVAFFGDETALPVILNMVESAPQNTDGLAMVMVRDLSDVQSVEKRSKTELKWCNALTPQDAAQSIQHLSLPEGDRHVFFAGERQAAKQMREAFLALGLKSGEFKAASYWTSDA